MGLDSPPASQSSASGCDLNDRDPFSVLPSPSKGISCLPTHVFPSRDFPGMSTPRLPSPACERSGIYISPSLDGHPRCFFLRQRQRFPFFLPHSSNSRMLFWSRGILFHPCLPSFSPRELCLLFFRSSAERRFFPLSGVSAAREIGLLSQHFLRDIFFILFLSLRSPPV